MQGTRKERARSKALSNKRETEIEQELRNAFENFKKEKKVSQKTQEAIRDAVNSENKELRDLGVMMAITAVKGYYAKKAERYVDHHRTAREDLEQQVALVVTENIAKYNGKNSLITYLNPFMTSAFMNVKNDGRGRNMTKYQMDTNCSVATARKQLLDAGYENPSNLDIRDFLQVYHKKNISEKTIERLNMTNVTMTPLDEAITQYPAREDADPEVAFITKENNLEMRRIFDKLVDRHKKLLLFELEYLNENSEHPTAKQIFERFRNEYSFFTKEDAERLRKAAYREFKSLTASAHTNHAPLNGVRRIDGVAAKENISVLQDIEDDITASFSADLTDE